MTNLSKAAIRKDCCFGRTQSRLMMLMFFLPDMMIMLILKRVKIFGNGILARVLILCRQTGRRFGADFGIGISKKFSSAMRR